MKKTKGDIAIVMSTVPDRRSAMVLAKTLVKHRLAACCSIIPQTTSVYWWKNKMEIAEEWVVLLKTSGSHLKPLVKELKKLHPYEVPEILVLNPVQVSKTYLKWIVDSSHIPASKKKNVVSKL